jgi:hypothetical protein
MREAAVDAKKRGFVSLNRNGAINVIFFFFFSLAFLTSHVSWVRRPVPPL